jgi:hypothetical protein
VAVWHERVNSENLGKFDAQSLLMIAIGKCPNSKSYLHLFHWLSISASCD